MIACVVFDFDGTLVDSVSIKESAHYDVVESLEKGPEAFMSLMKEGITGDRYEIYSRLVEYLGPHLSQFEKKSWGMALAEEYGKRCAQQIQSAPDWVGSGEFLRWLKARGYRTYVNSATPEKDLIEVVAKRNFYPLLDGVFGGPSSKVDNLNKIKKLESLANKDFLMIGDMDIDEEAARDFACSFVRVVSEASKKQLACPYAVYDLMDIADIIDSIKL